MNQDAASTRKAFRACLWLASLSLLVLLGFFAIEAWSKNSYWSSQRGSPDVVVSCALELLFLVVFAGLELASKIVAIIAIVRCRLFSTRKKVVSILLLWLLGPLFLIPFAVTELRASRER